jgi:hypothetical protein
MLYFSWLSAALASISRTAARVATIATADRTTLQQTETLATKLDDWASLLNNAFWSGGLLLAVQIIKDQSGVEGFIWLCISLLQLLLGVMTLLLGMAATHILIDRLNNGRNRKVRFFISLSVFAFLGLVGLGLVFTVNEYMKSHAAGIVATAT